MSTRMFDNPKIVSRDEWLEARKKLLAREKQLTLEGYAPADRWQMAKPLRRIGQLGAPDLDVRTRMTSAAAATASMKAAGPIPLTSPTRRCDTTAPTK